ncbi:TniB family NTP-binding protein [Aeromonas sp. MR19]|uniref:TniB family NTP-binding protein n=1 Tax=Aeromonas sp. MR19 TaxID=2923421 RepID=UPI001F4A2599|nr:TniB family NTP-binding protein [Aeromonas sp. MR19]MCH7377095.1 TniB family NTP-binding protein [Aeromonas sp. MR19]
MTDSLNIHQKIAELRKVVIFHPQCQTAFDAIRDAYLMSAQVGFPQHLLCVGQSGTGKSTLKSLIFDEYPPELLPDRELLPVLCVDTPSQPTIRNMAEAMLVQLGEPCFMRGSAIDKTNRILNLIKEKQVRLIIVDELQHFIDRGRRRAPLEVSDWLKTLIDQSQVSTVLMGLPRCEQILQVNEQLRRRYGRRLELNPFSIESPHEQSIFAGVITHFDQKLGLKRPLQLDGDLLRRFHFATNGIIDYVVRLMTGSYAWATQHSVPAIDRSVLGRAFVDWVWHEGKGVLNPFNDGFCWKRLDSPGMPFNLFEPASAVRASKTGGESWS